MFIDGGALGFSMLVEEAQRFRIYIEEAQADNLHSKVWGSLILEGAQGV